MPTVFKTRAVEHHIQAHALKIKNTPETSIGKQENWSYFLFEFLLGINFHKNSRMQTETQGL